MAGIINGGVQKSAFTDKQIYDDMVAGNQAGLSNADNLKALTTKYGADAGDVIVAYETQRPDMFGTTEEIMANVAKGPEGIAANAADPEYQAREKMDDYVRSLAPSGASPAPVVSGSNPASAAEASPVERLGDPKPWNVTPDQTVEGRIRGIINGTIGQQARAGAVGQMNERGLTNSTMAITAADDAAYRAAIPIATADAATASKAAGYNADQGNQFSVRNADYGNQYGLAKLSADTQMGTARLSADTQLATANLQAKTQMSVAQLNAENQQALARLEGDIKVQAQDLQNQNQVLLNTSQQAAQAFNQYLVSATNIQLSTTLDAEKKDLALRTLWQTTQTQLEILGAVNSLDLTSLLSDLGPLPPPAPTPAPTPAPAGGIVGGGSAGDSGGN
jgi:hypothetical protein